MTSVLVVDDDAALRSLLGRYLKADGYEVREAKNGSEAIDVYRLHAADLVITDMYMPDADGIDVIMRLRSEFPDARIVAMSGGGFLDQSHVLEFAERAGALRTLSKPFDRQSFLNAVTDALGQPRVQPADMSTAAAVAPARPRTIVPQDTGDAGISYSPEHFADKMDSMARMANGIAHEFNNILAVILGTADLALAATDLEPSVRDDLNSILVAGQRASAITGQLMEFSGSQALTLRPTRINDVLRQLEPQLRKQLPPLVTLKLQFHADAVIEADPARLAEVIGGLVANATDAMPAGGEVSVATMSVGKAGSRAMPNVAPESLTMIVVSDAGAGLTEMARARLFEPFFTTREQGKGTGLSLASVYGAVRQLRGSVEVESAPGFGTLVRLTLPTVAISDRSDSRPTPKIRDADDSEALLVVEDEPAVRAMICKALRRAGYLVLEANNGEDALRVLQEYHAPVQLVIADIMMPEMSGPELSEMLRQWYPHTRVLFISGNGARPVQAQTELANGTAFLGKPFTMEALAERVRGLLDAEWKD